MGYWNITLHHDIIAVNSAEIRSVIQIFDEHDACTNIHTAKKYLEKTSLPGNI